MTYRPGDSYLIDDETGLKIRRSEAVKRWDGAVVHRSVTNPRHPQDFVRAKTDRQLADVIRPRPLDIFHGPLVTTLTAPASVLATQLTLASTVGFTIGDRIHVMLDSGEIFDNVVSDILSLEIIDVMFPLPRAALNGARVVVIAPSTYADTYADNGYWENGYSL